MYQLYLNNFVWQNVQEQNAFALFTIKLVEKYIGFLVSKGKLFLPFEMSNRDCAVEALAEVLLFNDNRQFFKFSKYFNGLENPPKDPDEFSKELKSFLFSVTHQNITKIFQQADPTTYKIMRSLKEAVKNGNYKTTQFLSGPFIHRIATDFKGKMMEREDLLTLLLSQNGNFHFNHSNEFLSSVFAILEKEELFIPSIAFLDLVYLRKYFLFETFANSKNNGNQNHQQSELTTKFFLDDSLEYFNGKLSKYIKKQNFSENVTVGVYTVLEDVNFSILSDGAIPSIKFLTEKHFGQLPNNGMTRKVEYIVQTYCTFLKEEIEKESL